MFGRKGTGKWDEGLVVVDCGQGSWPEVVSPACLGVAQGQPIVFGRDMVGGWSIVEGELVVGVVVACA